MRILVLGGTHFIGAHAVRRLVALGHQVTVFHRGEAEADLPESVQHLHGNRKQLEQYADAFKDLAPDVVLDTGVMTEKNTEDVVSVFQGITGRLVVLSSGDVYRAYDRLRGKDPGRPDPTPLTEASPLRERLYPYRDDASGPEDLLYHYDKILVERVVMRQPETLPATVLRLPMVFGPGDYQHRLFPYLKRMDDNRPFILLAEDLAKFQGLRGYVEGMAQAIALCVTKEAAANRIYHVGYADSFSEEEWVRLIAKAAGWDGEIVKLPEDQLPESLRHGMDTRQDWSLDSSRIREELGYRELVPVDEALRRAVAWERANPPKKTPEKLFDYDAEDTVVADHAQRH